MKNDKSKSNFLKLNTIHQNLKKEISVQKDAAKKYQKFKKSASQPAYFLNQSRLKKISQIYRAASLQKLSKNYSLNRSKSLHVNVTPEKKVSTPNNNSFKKPSTINTLNINKAYDTNQKTRRLRLDKTLQNQNSHTLQTPTQTATKFFTTQVDRLQQIVHMNTEKAFIAQFDYFFKTLKDESFNRKGYSSDIKTLISKFCYLMQVCQDRKIKQNQKELKTKYNKIETDYSNVNTQLKKKSFKLQLLIKQIDQLKVHNMKIAKQLLDLKEEKRSSFGSQKCINRKKHLQINEVFELKIFGHQAQLTTPIYQQNLRHQSSNQDSYNEFQKCKNNNVEKVFSNFENEKVVQKISPNERLLMIKKIRDLEKKQKNLVKTLLVLKSDGIDVQRAFNEVASGQIDDNNISQSDLNLKKQHTPSYIRKMKNKDSYQADSSIIDSIQGLTVRCFEGQPSQQYVFYPIKHQYISKPLDEKMQQKLRLNFNVLYEEYQQPQQSQSQTQQSYQESELQSHPTI